MSTVAELDDVSIIGHSAFGIGGAQSTYLERMSDALPLLREETEYICEKLPEIEKELAPYTRTLSNGKRFTRIVAIDGSNTDSKEVLALAGFGYSASAVYDYVSPPYPPRLQELRGRVGWMRRYQYSYLYPTILRDCEELQMIIDASKHDPEIIFVNGSGISIALWQARTTNSIENKPLGNKIKEIYEKCFNVDNPDSIFNKVFEISKKVPVVFMPDASQSRMALRSYLSFSNSLPEYVRDVRVLTHILKSREYLEPVEYQKGLSLGATTSPARKYANELVITYIKPAVNGRPVMKLEFHRNHLDKLEDILRTVLTSYNGSASMPEPLYAAHVRSIKALPNLDSAARLAQILALEDCATNEELEDVFTAFSIARPSKRW